MRLPGMFCLLPFLVIGCSSPPPPSSSTAPAAARSTRYEDLLSLFADWRTFQQPKRVNGVPDYSAAAMAAQRRDLAGYVNRLAAIDPSALADSAAGRLPRRPRGDERARLRSSRAAAVGEQPGVLRHGVPRRERSAGAGGAARGGRRRGVEVRVPALGEGRGRDRRRPRDRPGAARAGEDEPRRAQKDLWTYGTKAIKDQSAALTELASRVDGHARAISRARSIARQGRDRRVRPSWLDSQASSQDGAVGHRRRQLQLVPEERPARAVHVAGRGHADGARARALVGVARDRGAAQREAAAAGPDRERRGARHSASTRRSPSTWRSSRITIS